MKIDEFKLDKFNTFYIIFMLYFIPRFLEYTTFTQLISCQSLFTSLKNISYILIMGYNLFFIIKKDRFQIKYILVLLFCFIYFAYQAFWEQERAIFVVFFFSLCFDIKYLDKYIKRTYTVSVILYCLTIVCSFLGIIDNVSTEVEKLGIILYRNSMGFNYPGQMIMSLIPIMFMHYYLNRKKITWKINFIWFLLGSIVFMVSKTVMGYMIILLFIVISIVIRYIKSNPRVEVIKNVLIRFSPYICCFFTLFLLWLKALGTRVGEFLDGALNGRLNLGNIFIDMFGIKMFGTDFVNSTEYYYQIIDSEYIYMLVAAGIIYTLVSLKLMEVCVCYAKRSKMLCLIWVLIFINAIVNNGVFNYVFNPFSIMLVPAIEYATKKNKNTFNVTP